VKLPDAGRGEMGYRSRAPLLIRRSGEPISSTAITANKRAARGRCRSRAPPSRNRDQSKAHSVPNRTGRPSGRNSWRRPSSDRRSHSARIGRCRMASAAYLTSASPSKVGRGIGGISPATGECLVCPKTRAGPARESYERRLKDIGISRLGVLREIRKPFWRA
jgi:hypothetical protein